MIKFFRNIRKSLLEQNKMGKYFKYAIGEILLVVIGILIALQINNWNESNKTKSEEALYLKRLIVDLKKDSIYYNNRIEKAKLLIEKNTSFINKMYETQQTKADFIELVAIPMWSSEYLTIQDNTYRELVSSGKLNILSNEDIKINVVDFYRLAESYKYSIRDFNEYTRTLMGNHVSKYPGSIKDISDKENYNAINIKKLLSEDSFNFINNPMSSQFNSIQDVALVYINKHKSFIKTFEELKLKTENLISKINEDLND